MIIEILFILHVVNGIHIIIRYTYMNTYTNTTLYNYLILLQISILTCI